MKTTPGPWTIDTLKDARGKTTHWIVHGKGTHQVMPCRDDDTAEGDANLIVEAPALFEEFLFMVEHCVDRVDDVDGLKCVRVTLYNDHLDRLKKLISKITGEELK